MLTGIGGLRPGGPRPGRTPGTRERRGRPDNPGRPGRPGTTKHRGSRSQRNAPPPCAGSEVDQSEVGVAQVRQQPAQNTCSCSRTPGPRRGITSPRPKAGPAASTSEIYCLADARSPCPTPFHLVGLLLDVLQLAAATKTAGKENLGLSLKRVIFWAKQNLEPAPRG